MLFEQFQIEARIFSNYGKSLEIFIAGIRSERFDTCLSVRYGNINQDVKREADSLGEARFFGRHILLHGKNILEVRRICSAAMTGMQDA